MQSILYASDAQTGSSAESTRHKCDTHRRQEGISYTFACTTHLYYDIQIPFVCSIPTCFTDFTIQQERPSSK